ncbi:RNA polymerase sigma factor [Allorhodopirellula solitaria]|uniref:RNA polymerase sigma factor YlaC n=1 Tax=Allorhodopirellula solitaria TaxID=2527987 RepID=A0A5C5XTY1_9BACT|nr:RNA polymerase sigma factor [Allorhodopirellula solitaria]TWT66697.1 RNA polymerase sigma factor YlaC [Allorhodopirellula solitaria]
MTASFTPGTAERLRRGDSEAIESVVEAFFAPVYRYLLCRGCSQPEAEELTAETFFQVLKSVSGFRGGEDQIRAFVYATARHVRAGHYRACSRTAASDVTWSTMESDGESPQDSLLKDEQKLQISCAIAKLEEPTKEVVILRFINELSIKEIAAICEMPIGTIKSHLHRAKIELKQLLADSGPTQ